MQVDDSYFLDVKRLSPFLRILSGILFLGLKDGFVFVETTSGIKVIPVGLDVGGDVSDRDVHNEIDIPGHSVSDFDGGRAGMAEDIQVIVGIVTVEQGPPHSRSGLGMACDTKCRPF